MFICTRMVFVLTRENNSHKDVLTSHGHVTMHISSNILEVIRASVRSSPSAPNTAAEIHSSL